MIFRPELAKKILAGEKTVTRRLCSDNSRSPWWRERSIYQCGKVFTVNPGRGVTRIGEARVVKCERENLGYLTDIESRAEGFADEAAFRAAFEAINGPYLPWATVWRCEFEVIR